jgi:hypothetical protein
MTEFYGDKTHLDGLSSRCKICIRWAQRIRYKKSYKSLQLVTSFQIKLCSMCRIPRLRNEFTPHKKSWDGLLPNCKTCSRNTRLKRGYGISETEVSQMLEDQSFTCPICGADISDSPVVDHDHESGYVRNLLCSSCNIGLGHFRDNPSFLESAADYLRHHRKKADEHQSLSADPATIRWLHSSHRWDWFRYCRRQQPRKWLPHLSAGQSRRELLRNSASRQAGSQRWSCCDRHFVFCR